MQTEDRSDRNPVLMGPVGLVVPAASAALIAVLALSASAAVTPAGARPPSGSSVRVGSTAPSPSGPSLATSTPGFPEGATSRTAPNRGFTWPLSPRPGIRRYLEPPKSQWSRGHRGVDLLASIGQPVLSAGEGVVAFSGVIAGRGVIVVRHFGGLRTTYEPVDQRLTAGSRVHRGVPIGLVSSTPGHCMPLPCLHWGAISGQSYRDPLSLLGFGRPILLPLG